MEFDFRRILEAIIDRWKMIVVATVALGLCAALYSLFLITPLYKASATMYVNNNKNTFDGKSIFITGEIDLNNHAWSVIGNKNYPLEIHGNIVMQDAKIMGLDTSSVYAYNYGLFGNVRIWDFTADNVQMKNAHMNATTKDYDGVLFGQLEVARNGKCSIVNSEFSGDMAGDSQCGAIIGCINGKSENAQVIIQNCTTRVESTDYRTA